VITEAITGRSTAEDVLKEMGILFRLAERVNRTLDLDDILCLALETTTGMTGMSHGGVWLLDPSAKELVLRAHAGISPDLTRMDACTKADEGSLPRMLASLLALDGLSEVTKEHWVVVENEGLQSLIGVPLLDDDRPLGMIVLADQEQRRFRPDELRALSIVGRHVGSAIHRTELQAQQLRVSVLEERHTIAQQLHDGIAQTLGYLGLQVDNVMENPTLDRNAQVQADLEEVRTAIDNAYRGVRDSITRLSKDIPDDFDLSTALQETVEEFERAAGCNINLDVSVDWVVSMAPLVAIQAYHIIHEALTNVRKHAAADTVHLALQRFGDDMIEIVIRDNGQGFDMDSALRSNRAGFGLRFMAERAERVAGSFRVESRPGDGTQIVVRLPSS
jgi:nitrate/nitrite-specific signal transduction histidine kinase